MARKSASGSVPVSSVKHRDKRVNIPTQELRDFVASDESAPKTMLYPRDPSLDPQLVWKGKDEQDRKDLEVPVVPVYIQEKIQPQAIVEQVRAEAKKEAPGLASLFSDFNGIVFEDLVDFYHHEQNWTNRMILGDSLLVMTSLAEKERLKGKVQMIYVDPPYGIKFGSNWQVSTRKRDVKDGKAEDATRQPEQIKAFRDTWALGIHSYLSYLRDRLTVARDLLTESGSIFVQIGDENVHLVRCLLDEVFGSENFISTIYFATTGGFETAYLSRLGDQILWYSKSRDMLKYRQLYLPKQPRATGGWGFNYVQESGFSRRSLSKEERSGEQTQPPDGRLYMLDNLISQGPAAQGEVEFSFEGQQFTCGPRSHWKTTLPGMSRLGKAWRVQAATTQVRYIRFFDDFSVQPLNSDWDDTAQAGYVEDKLYVVQTSLKVIERCLLMTTDPGDLVLDPTCGSGTTAYVAEQWGRRWITIDTSRVALALARTRLMAARYPYYLLADSPEGLRKEAEISGHVPPDIKTSGDIKKGFVCKRVPHVTLKSIANNEEIDVIHEKFQVLLEPLRAELNRLLKKSWEEWEIPREAEEKWPEKATKVHEEWWKRRRERQKEMDASIARRAEYETLVDQPYEDNKRVRVSGPFTVESLSPHRVLAPEEDRPAAEAQAEDGAGRPQFVPMILDNLKKAGVQNTRKAERLKFDRLEPYAGLWIQAAGEYTDKDGKARRVAVAIGPEHGTVGADQVKEAAKEALKGVGFDLLVVCGFAFDAHAGESAKEFQPPEKGDNKPAKGGAIAEEERQYGKLPILLARMNPDLAMGEELLKKTGAGNLFMVFGEPDLEVRKTKDGKLIVNLKGVDVYDPTTGVIRSSSTDDVACWFIDTNYNGESFFVRHAYFCGGDEPYDKLKRALRAEVDEAAWSALYSTTSLPFDPPETGKIAVKVINHYGDEVLKVYEV
ncbi:MAG: site-specific DNA-methyltransferase [Acidobacteriota bacterium]